MAERRNGTRLGSAPLRASRAIPASIDRVWRAWTARELLAQWWAPEGFEFTVARLDPRTGGAIDFEFVEVGAARHPQWRSQLEAAGVATSFSALGRFTLIDPPHRLAFRQELRFGPRARPLDFALSASFARVPAGTHVELEASGTETKHWVTLGRANLDGQLARLAALLTAQEHGLAASDTSK